MEVKISEETFRQLKTAYLKDSFGMKFHDYCNWQLIKKKPMVRNGVKPCPREGIAMKSRNVRPVSKPMSEWLDGPARQSQYRDHSGADDLAADDYDLAHELAEDDGFSYSHDPIQDILGGKVAKSLNSRDLTVGKPGFGREDDASNDAFMTGAKWRTKYNPYVVSSMHRWNDKDIDEALNCKETKNAIRGYTGGSRDLEFSSMAESMYAWQ